MYSLTTIISNLKFKIMRRSVKVLALTLSLCVLMSSCIGSFTLTSKLKNWNDSLGDKFVCELVFLGLAILPVYEIAVMADALVLNTIEFWTGNKLISMNDNVGDTKIVQNANGDDVLVKTTENGYNLSDGETAINLIFDETDNSWSVEYNNQVNKLLTIEGDNVLLNMHNGETVSVTLDEAGVDMARQMVMPNYALK